ncbi:MAG: hypothetical protein OM95_10410 [Bdellovibrio sp. ArHS]|uniref:hypothetical protein n=1 Tax=Bdellovibrio sp. ArHS TaxID=1569284 RepID=UPI0005832E73|nr:hypothetical protein [Bdellovibrio sp. ArHS]KHD88173.1 MAG: hypothetical protein OM95_10410 [Bdellovibrio sp. ArHS]
MQTSKMNLVKALLGLSLSTVLAACNLPAPKDKESENTTAATFTAQAMADKSKALEVRVSGDFALPSSKIFNLQACLKDVAYDKVIAGHDFLIEETNTKVTSDKAGCLTWAEKIAFNFLGESQYIRIERKIKGLGLHKGVQKVAFAINPWSHGENLSPVLNPDDGNSIPALVNGAEESTKALKGFSAENKMTTRPLWVEDGRLFVTEQSLTSAGVQLLVEMRPAPALQLTKMNGEMVLYPLKAGSFKARLKIIHVYQQNGQEIRRLLSESPVMDVKMENASLGVKSVMSLPAIPTRGQLMLGLELDPVQAPQGLTGFNGIYLLGEYDQIKGASFLRLNTLVAQTKDFKIASYINSTMAEVAQKTTPVIAGAPSTTTADMGTKAAPEVVFDSDTYQKPKIEVSQLEFRFIRVGQEKTATREVFYTVRACVRNGLDQKNTRAHSFKVTKYRQSESETPVSVTVKTDNNSCINWDESITFKYFDCQRYLKGFVQIENADLGMNEKLDIIVNPWESMGVLARDMRYVDQSEKLILSCSQENRPRTQLLVEGFSYNTLSYNYNVDSLLNLTVTKKIQVKMEPRLLVYSSLAHGRGESERLRDGIYLLKMAIVQNRDYDSNNSYVAGAQKLMTVMSGQINTDVTLQTQDLKALGNRNNMLVEIYPVDEQKITLDGSALRLKDETASLDSAIDTTTGLETPTFIGPITLNIDEASRPLRVMEASSINAYLLNGQGDNANNGKFVINKIVAEGQKIALEKRQRMQARADKNQFAKENNLEVINLKTADEKAPLVKALIGSSQLDERLLVTKADLKELLEKGGLTPATAQKLCAFWASDYFRTLHADKGGVIYDNSRMGFGMDCYNLARKDPKRFFQIEKHVMVKEVAGSQFQKGFNQGLTVGTSFSLSTSHQTTKSRSTSISTKLGLSKKFLDLFSVGVDLSYTLSWSVSDSNSASNSISVNTSTSMTVQQNVFKVRVNKHEQCAIVRLNPVLFMKDPNAGWFSGRRDYLSFLNARLSEEEMSSAATRGLMVCDGEIRQEPLDITENYYLIAQESNSSQMQDNGDARNRNFFIALRSKNDFNRFVLAMKGDAKMPTTATKEEDPAAQAAQMMEQLFQMSGPAYPGTFLAH